MNFRRTSSSEQNVKSATRLLNQLNGRSMVKLS